MIYNIFELPRWHNGKESTCRHSRCKRQGFHPWVGKIPWRRKCQPTSVFLPGKSHGQRSLEGYSSGVAKVRHDWSHTHNVELGMPGLLWLFRGKESACQCRRCRFDFWVGKIPWRRKCQPTSVFLPGKSHGQRSLAEYSPWGHKNSSTTEQLNSSNK